MMIIIFIFIRFTSITQRDPYLNCIIFIPFLWISTRLLFLSVTRSRNRTIGEDKTVAKTKIMIVMYFIPLFCHRLNKFKGGKWV